MVRCHQSFLRINQLHCPTLHGSAGRPHLEPFHRLGQYNSCHRHNFENSLACTKAFDQSMHQGQQGFMRCIGTTRLIMRPIFPAPAMRLSLFADDQLPINHQNINIFSDRSIPSKTTLAGILIFRTCHNWNIYACGVPILPVELLLRRGKYAATSMTFLPSCLWRYSSDRVVLPTPLTPTEHDRRPS